ncbi:MAG TPA: hypothetical protein VFO54_03420 [Chryseosolibacter sp.]|nr:hypothetical protein [Chryseosolibacter sp.]
MTMYLRAIFILILASVSVDSTAQFWKNKTKAERENAGGQPTSLDPSSSAKKEYVPKQSRKSTKGPTYGLEEEFYKRMEKVEKAREKNERMMEKPQYSDPLYFGHKRPPKKRKPSKMKFCKVCGIRH